MNVYVFFCKLKSPEYLRRSLWPFVIFIDQDQH